MEVGFALSLAALVVIVVLWRRSSRQLADLRADNERVHGELSGVRADVARLAAALAGTGEGLIVLDGGGRIVATNSAAEELAGLSAADSVGRPLVELLPWPRLQAALTAPSTGAHGEAFELDATVGNGRVLLVRVRSLRGLGTVVGIDDQSRLKQLESLRRDFVANVSHELKTPLAAIQGLVETMIDDAAMEASTRHRFLERVARQSERLASLVADLLTLSRLDESIGDRDAAPCDFVLVIKETIRDLASLADKKQLQLLCRLPEPSIWVTADRETLRQVIGNLVDNAIKYTPEGGRVTVGANRVGDRVRLEVVDTGIGLSPDDQERIFERFYRVDRARSRELGGTGLGLAIVKNTVKNAGGEVGVESQLGRGSTFWVEWPCLSQRPGLADNRDAATG